MTLASGLGKTRWVTAVLLSAFMLAGCIGLMPSPFRPSPGPKQTPHAKDLAEAFDIVCRDYKLGPDDVLRYYLNSDWHIPVGSYKLETLDEISVKFLLDSTLNEKVVIRPDGMITLQGIGDVEAAGFTPMELAARIEKRYLDADIFGQDELQRGMKKYKLVTVHVEKLNEKVGNLVESLRTAYGDSAVEIAVNPDGTLDIPPAKQRVIAAGKTVAQVEHSVNKLYEQIGIKHANVSLQLAKALSRKVYVIGQVHNPGAYEIRQPITAVHAVALAGGHVPESADLTSVILISKDVNGKPIGRRLDLKRIFDIGDMSSAILVKPYDVLYVPKTYVRDVRVFMDEYFRTVSDVASFVDRFSRRLLQVTE